tara:strand:- start:2305 stop:3030 length:726 start_codon:yes stop_codon:yes gene_type:complete
MKKYFALLSILALILVSCDEEVLVFDSQGSSALVKFDRGSADLPIELGSSSTITLGFTVSKLSDAVRTFDVEIDTDASNPVSGSYSVGTATVPAGSYSGTIQITGTDVGLEAGDPRALVLKFSEVEGVTPDGRLTLNLYLFCPSDLAGEYTYQDGNRRPVTVTEISSGVYRVSRDNAFTTAYPFTITDRCNDIEVSDAAIEANFGLEVTGTGVSDPANGMITIIYNVAGNLSNRTMTMKRN